jgi:hypothetical protein
MQFRQDNTEGWSDEDLAWMNREYEHRVADLDPESQNYGDECQRIAEEILDERYARSAPDLYRIQGYEVVEKTVTARGTSGGVYVPVSWVGKRVKIVRIDP